MLFYLRLIFFVFIVPINLLALFFPVIFGVVPIKEVWQKLGITFVFSKKWREKNPKNPFNHPNLPKLSEQSHLAKIEKISKQQGASKKQKAQKNLTEQASLAEITSMEKTIWVKLSSLGEWSTARPFLEKLTKRTGKKLLVSYFNRDIKKYFDKNPPPNFVVDHFFYPLENPLACKVIVKRYSVCALVLVEFELWPITILTVRALGLPVFMVNATLFAKEGRRYRFFLPIFKRALGSLTGIYVSSKNSKDRMASLLKVDEKKMKLMGEFKVDRAIEKVKERKLNHKLCQTLKKLADKRKIIIFSSFHFGERSVIVNYLAARKQDALIILAPRYVQQQHVKKWTKFFSQKKISFLLRSEISNRKIAASKKNDVFILDSYGELFSLFSMVDLAVIGGSFIRHGGQDVLEPLSFGVPLITGPWMHHFLEMVELFSNCIFRVDQSSLPKKIDELLFARGNLKKRNLEIKKTMQSFSGASEKTALAIAKHLQSPPFKK